ncbi:AAA family ATPase, partial [Byssothecium circinans]
EAVIDSFNVSKDQFELLFSALIPAFVLKEKEWLWLLSDELNDVRWNTVAFESLRLEPQTNDLVQALVKGHKIKSNVFDDVMPGKGLGLIFLLHGYPGLGKTLTAESVADYLERPLYSISGGELSTDVTILEERLNETFDLLKRWNAVSLLDEADVLLCKRNSAEMDRNAIVAVFLRKIEYFQGVSFLTTNRKEDYDDAFKSRIHVMISYPDLSEGAQSTIWKKLISANSELKVDDSWTEDVFSALGRLKLNDRTIKNIMRTAVAYVHANDEALGARHVLAIVSTELKEVGDLNKVAMTPHERWKKR